MDKVDIVDERADDCLNFRAFASGSPQVLGLAPRNCAAKRCWRRKAYQGAELRHIQAGAEQSRVDGRREQSRASAKRREGLSRNETCNSEAAQKASNTTQPLSRAWQAAFRTAREACLSQVGQRKPLLASILAFPALSHQPNALKVSDVSPRARTQGKPTPTNACPQKRSAQLMQQVQQMQMWEIERQARARPAKSLGGGPERDWDGFLLPSTAKSALILTALYVVKDAHSISAAVYGDEGRKLSADEPTKHNEALDMAVLEVDFPPNSSISVDLPKYNFAANSTLYSTESMHTVDSEWVIVPNTTATRNDSNSRTFSSAPASPAVRCSTHTMT